MALTPPGETAQTTRPRRGSVLGAVRLLVASWFGAGGRLSLGRPGSHPVFLTSRAGGGPRLRGGADRVGPTRPDWQRGIGALAHFADGSAGQYLRVLTRQRLHRKRRGRGLAWIMASDESTGHRSRNLWPVRQESPGNPRGSGHRSASTDLEKSLLRWCYARVPPTFLVMKGSPVRVRASALEKPRSGGVFSLAIGHGGACNPTCDPTAQPNARCQGADRTLKPPA
jgi:hypothetical protein